MQRKLLGAAHMVRFFTGGLLVLSLIVWFCGNSQQSEAEKPAPELRRQIRRPVALVIQGEKLFVGCRESGSLSVIDPKTGKILAEHDIANRIADVVPFADSSLLVLDDQHNQLLKVSWQNDAPQVTPLAELPVVCVKLAVDEE